MPANSRAIDAIFTRLLVRYGAAWSRLWSDIPMDAIKADWAEQLEGMSNRAIEYALLHLPSEKPPATAAAFAALARAMPVHAIPPSRQVGYAYRKADPQRVAEALARVEYLRDGISRTAWADNLKEAMNNGASLTEAQRAMVKACFQSPAANSGPIVFHPIANELLPPGMRSE